MINFETTLVVVLTFMVWSYFWKSNFVYKIAVSLFSGVSVAYLACEALMQIYYKNISPLATGDLIQLLPLLFAFMLLFGAVYRKFSFIARYPSSIGVAMNLGSTAAGAVIAQMYRQILRPITSPSAAITTIVILVLILYFISTFKFMESKTFRTISTLGRYLLMLAFGFTFGGGIMSGVSRILDRLQYIFWTWLEIGG